MRLEELIDAYGEKLLRYAASIVCNHQDAEDVVQDVFLSVYQNFKSFDGQNISAWLYKITYNKSLNKLKKRKLLFWSKIPKDTAAPGDGGLNGGTLHALTLLKPQDRALLFARIFEGYTYEELAEQMGKTPAALRKRYERAKKKMAENLRENQ